MHLPPQILELTSTFLESADAASPGLIQGLYLTGSIALNDFQSHCSDIDFVAVLADRADAAELRVLAAAHAAVRDRHPRPDFDGTYLTWSDLAAGPEGCPPAPFSHEGRFEASGRFALDPVTWHELVAHSIPVRGPVLGRERVWCDAAVLRSWTLANLAEYWTPWVVGYRNAPVTAEASHGAVAWGVLGVSRLHYTLSTGRITSKTGAGEYALQAFERRWAPIISEALRIRLNPEGPSVYSDFSKRRDDVVAFMECAITTAYRAGAA